MSTPTVPSIKALALGDLEHELRNTRRALERVPDEHLDWKPHEKSWSLGALAWHVASLHGFATSMLTRDELDVAAAPPPDPAAAHPTRDDILRQFEETAAALRAALDAADDEVLMQTWTLRNGEKVFLSVPRVAALRSMGISHIVHHRGELMVYLRQVGVPVPGLYGPSADEKF